jgi:hypothetical protein
MKARRQGQPLASLGMTDLAVDFFRVLMKPRVLGAFLAVALPLTLCGAVPADAQTPGSYAQYSMMFAGSDGSAGEWYGDGTPQVEWAWSHTSPTTANINWGSPQYWPEAGPNQPSDLEHFNVAADSSGLWVEVSGWSGSTNGQTSDGTDYRQTVTSELYQPGCAGTPQSLPVANGEEKYALYNVPASSYCLYAVGTITSPENRSVNISFEHWQEWSYGFCSNAYYSNQTCIEQHETWNDNSSGTMTQTLNRYGWMAKGLGWFKSVNGPLQYDERYYWTW